MSLMKRRQATCLRWRRRADGNPTSVEFIKSRPPHDGQEGLPPAALFLRNDEGAGVGELFYPRTEVYVGIFLGDQRLVIKVV